MQESISSHHVAHLAGQEITSLQHCTNYSSMQVGGRRVMGLAPNALATRVAATRQLLWDVPTGWSLADAATAPLAYATAYYALVIRGAMQPGQRVLVHSGCGAAGLAAISICLHRGCKVLAATLFKEPTTASTCMYACPAGLPAGRGARFTCPSHVAHSRETHCAS